MLTTANHSFSFQKNTPSVCARQIAFAAAFLLPVAKLLEVPSILARYAKGDLLLPALVHFLLQTLLLLGILYAASRSEKSILERLQLRLGKWMVLLYVLYAAYFLLAAILPLLDLEKFVYAVFFDTEPTTFSFFIFFFFSAFVCAKGIQSVARSADLCLFFFLFPFLALVVMAFPECDFSNLMPLFGTSIRGSFSAFKYTTPHFSDVALLLPLVANLKYKENDGVKITVGYCVGALTSLLFFAVFYGVYSHLAPREHYAFSKIAQYFPALSVVGRIDLFFVYFLSIVLLLYTCLPLFYTTECLSLCLKTKRKTALATVFNFLLFLFVLYCNKHYNTFYAVISGNLSFIFWLIAYLLPIFLLFLPNMERKHV